MTPERNDSMNFLILNGSPKGKDSITLQTALYLEKLHPEHRFAVIDAGRRPTFPLDHTAEFARQTAAADCLIFCYPVYTFLIPSQLMRFMEAMEESGVDLHGKYATQITTSKHFYDMTAHRFVREFSGDLGLSFVDGLSADMEDLLSEKGRSEAEQFFDYLLFCMKYGVKEPSRAPIASPAHRPVTVPDFEKLKDGSKRVAVVADLSDKDSPLAAMIARFRAVFPYETDLVNLRDFRFSGGCLGCFRCAADGVCVYKDGFSDLLRERIQTADAIVTAFSIRDHGMGSLFKTYDDRQFCNGHRTVTVGKPAAALVSGNYPAEENLRTVLEARAETGGNFWCGAASDQTDPDREITDVALRLAYALRYGHTRPANFWGVGGMKIFRDLIWQMQGMMKADHRFYKEHGQYDFPQKKPLRMLAMYAVGAMNSSPAIRKKIGGKMTEGMLMPYKKVLAEAEKKARR